MYLEFSRYQYRPAVSTLKRRDGRKNLFRLLGMGKSNLDFTIDYSGSLVLLVNPILKRQAAFLELSAVSPFRDEMQSRYQRQ